MSNNINPILITLLILAIMLFLNILAVSSGLADSYYKPLTEWLNTL